MNLAQVLDAAKTKAEQGPWFPASGGTEKPFFTKSGKRLLYCWQPTTGSHVYIDCDTDLILSDDEAYAALGF